MARNNHTHLTTLMKFSPDGSMLVTASEREPPKLWNTSTGKLIKEIPLKSTQSMIKDIDFSPNSKWLGIIHYFRQVSIIPIDLKDLIGLAKNRVQYQLSEEEKKKYGINN